MAYRNFINIPTKNRNSQLYRIMSIERLLQMFKANENVLVKPRLWDDPFENFILNSPGVLPDDEKVEFGFREHLYGQCWSIRVESDAMWRVFAPLKNGVKIRTTVTKLYNSLYSQAPVNVRDISCFIGRVKYMTKNELKKFVDDFNPSDHSGDGIAETLLIKRKPFSHEREVRLIFFQHNEKMVSKPTYAYRFNPIELIDRIVFDPRMDVNLYNIYKKELKELGFKGDIVQSGLYKPPSGFAVKI